MAEGTSMPSEQARSYLSKPYTRIIVPEEDGTFRAEILEFPGCLATGDTPEEALRTIDDVALSWLESALENKQPIPEPVENTEFSGRLVLRLPKSLHKKASAYAARDGVSLNQFIATSLAEHVGERARSQSQITFNTTLSSVNVGAVFTEYRPGLQGFSLQSISPAVTEWTGTALIPSGS